MSSELSSLRVAVVHDWLTGHRGGEHVLEAILGLFPRAEIFTLFHFPGSVSAAIERHPIHTSSLQSLATRIPNYRYLLPLLPRAIGEWTLRDYDLVISSSHCVAKGARSGRAPHVCYCHTPMRYIWDRFDDYFPPEKPFRRFAGNLIAPHLREWDRRTAAEVDVFVANSAFVQERIRRCYGRSSEVVHPFVGDRFFEGTLRERREGFHLIVSALVPYKRIDLAIDAAERSGERLVIVGTGPDEKALRARSSGTKVEWLGWVETERVVSLMGRAESLLIPGVEDFGITAIEALASGTPVVSVAAGGVPESVQPGRTGLLFEPGDPEALAAAMVAARSRPWDRDLLRRRARAFSRRRFQEDFRTLIEGMLASGTRPPERLHE
ncbi:MAG TPA: glycosyltransferase [Thermoanaerobaculia bacterium]|nr:glycosyltransferase [Thermoanaerobaculia bacterium]